MNNRGNFDARNGAFFGMALSRSVRKRAGLGAGGSFISFIRRIRLLAEAVAFHRKQTKKRIAAAAKGKTIPGILIASVTRRCNLNCLGCYSKTLRPDTEALSPELSDERFLRIFREAIDLGCGTIMVAGGEPLLRRGLIQELATFKGIMIPVFTNGTLIDNEYLDLFASSQIVPIFSVEGDSSFTAERRGEGIHEAILTTAAELKRRGGLFGFSVTLTAKNADTVLSEQFLNGIERLGAAILFLVEFVPVTAGSDHLIITDDQKAELSRANRFDKYEFMTVSLPGDEEAFGGCLAAGRGFIHIAADGSLEACPFAPFSDTNVASSSLAEALDSPLMKKIRDHHGELTETKGGCALWNKRGWVAALGSCRTVIGTGTAGEESA